jgi:hypothetical protein
MATVERIRLIMQTLQKRAGLLIHMDPRSKNSSSPQAVKRVFTWVAFVGLLCMQEPSMTHALQRAENNSVSSTSIRLVLQTSKGRYRAAEPIGITAYLENVSQNKTYYVGNDLGNLFSIESFHYFELQIIDEKGRDVPIGRGAGTSIWKPGTTVTEKLAQYVQLRPKMIFGLKNDGDVTLRPGQYRLTATYHEVEALDWTEAELKALLIPVWTQTLVSNTVIITVVS